MSAKPLTEYEFKKQVKALSQFRGRGTELISVYITPKYPISEITGKLRDEFGQASNIKSASTRKNVQSALEKILHYLKGLNKPPDNGLAVFCGNVSESEGHIDIELYSVIPPTPVTVQFYRCESIFVIEPLREMLDRTGTYGLVVLDGKEATVALLKGTQITVIKRLHSTAQQKQHHGGQCLHEDTIIQKANGEIIPIKQLCEGEKIVSVNLDSMKTCQAECTAIYSRSSNTAFKLVFESPGESITATPEHLFFVLTEKGFEEKTVEELEIGDKVPIVISDNSKLANHKITFCTLKQKTAFTPLPEEKFYDLVIPSTQKFIANRLVVHNSAARFQRIHEETVEKYYQRIGEAMNAFVGIKNFEGVLVGGPGPSKDNFLKLAAFNYQLKILGSVDIGYTDEYGLREIIDKSGEIIAGQEAVKEKKLLDEFLKQAVTNGLVAYGLENVQQALAIKKIEQLLVTEELSLKRVQYKCGQCGKTSEKIVEQVVEKDCECGGKFKPGAETDVVNDLISLAEEQGTHVQIISRDTAEGRQFHATFNGIGAFLRYR